MSSDADRPTTPASSDAGHSSTASRKLLELITSSWISQAVRTAAELRLADLLQAGPRTADDLAAATGTHAPSLCRLLRALSTIEICTERDDGTFAITPTGALLSADAPQSLHAWTIWWGAHLWPVWEQLPYSVRTGKSARSLLSGTDGFGHLERDPEAAAVFHRALAELTRLAADEVVAAYDFSWAKTVVDVGGGYGQLLATILRANPSTSGVLFDLPHSIGGAIERFRELGLADRCQFVAGDFFESVPAGGDAYVIKSVVHDWDDHDASRLLATCRRAIGKDARLVLVEQVMPDKFESSPTHRSLARSDLTMLVALAAQERTEAQFRTLLADAGFRATRIVPCAVTFSVIEAVPL